MNVVVQVIFWVVVSSLVGLVVGGNIALLAGAIRSKINRRKELVELKDELDKLIL